MLCKFFIFLLVIYPVPFRGNNFVDYSDEKRNRAFHFFYSFCYSNTYLLFKQLMHDILLPFNPTNIYLTIVDHKVHTIIFHAMLIAKPNSLQFT